MLADNMAVALSAERLELRPGDSTEVEVTVRNSGQTVEHYSTSVVGLPRGARYTAEPAISHLMPGDAGTVKVRISLPESSEAAAGRHTLGMLVRSPYHGDISRCEEFDLHVVPVAALTMTAHPQVVVGGWAGKFALNLGNSGNTPLGVALTCTDPEDAVLFSFRPRHPTIQPGGSIRVRMNVRATRPWTGSQVRRALTVRAKADPDLSAEQALTFVQRPQIAAGLLRLLAMALGVAVMAGAVIIGALLVRHKGSDNTVPRADPATAPPGVPIPGVTPTAKPPGDEKPPVHKSTDLPPPPPDPNATIVDFSRRGNGEPAGDRIIQGDEYAKGGVTLTTDTQVTPTGCKDATALALRTNPTLGSFLTSARPVGVDLCNTQPIRVTFTKPAKQVQITYAGLGAQYKATLQLSDGSLQQVAGASKQDASAQTLTYTAKGDVTVLGLVFGHASPDPNAKDPTIIKRLVFTPAG